MYTYIYIIYTYTYVHICTNIYIYVFISTLMAKHTHTPTNYSIRQPIPAQSKQVNFQDLKFRSIPLRGAQLSQVLYVWYDCMHARITYLYIYGGVLK